MVFVYKRSFYYWLLNLITKWLRIVLLTFPAGENNYKTITGNEANYYEFTLCAATAANK
jgi:hypothetical protein